MADRTLENMGYMDGTYAGAAFEDSPSSLLEVTLTDITFEKTADQSLWINGDLTITFTVDNTEGVGPLDGIVIRDTLDNTKFSYIETSISAQIATTEEPIVVTTLVLGTDYTVTYTENTPSADEDSLVITFLPSASIPVGSVATISFRGSKVPVTP